MHVCKEICVSREGLSGRLRYMDVLGHVCTGTVSGGAGTWLMETPRASQWVGDCAVISDGSGSLWLSMLTTRMLRKLRGPLRGSSWVLVQTSARYSG